MDSLWMMLYGKSYCSADNGITTSGIDLVSMSDPLLCISRALIICFDVSILVMFLFNGILKRSSNSVVTLYHLSRISGLQIVSAFYNGLLGLVYLCFGVWVLEEKLRWSNTALPLHEWLLFFLQGLTWFPLGLIVSLRGKHFPKAPLGLLSILGLLSTGVAFVLSLFAAVSSKEISVKISLDVLTFIGACLLVLCTYKGFKHEKTNDSLYTPLNGGEVNGINKAASVSLFAEAGCVRKLSFWCLNPMMRRGREKTLKDDDIPKLREEDSAKACYSEFLAQLGKQNEPSILNILVLCHWKSILVSGLFALVKIITISAGPLLLNAFIQVAEGKESFENEGFVLAVTLFLSKILESLGQRQWYFRSSLTGLKVRSLLTAAIYKKQLRLSNAAKMTHSNGEITNYVTVDAYRIGEFPFWMHQTWTTILQICFALFILYRAVGLASVASMVVIILTVLCNIPLAKLQHKYQSNLMVTQDERLKASTEALVNMKVLKLYAWENHFKNVIEELRSDEYKWLSGVQMRKAYNVFLFWSSHVLVSAATFGACYFLEIPLYASNVFTFVATVRLLQDPIRSVPDVIGGVIQAKVALSRISKFLEAPELDNTNIRKKTKMEIKSHAIVIKSANFSWEENLSKPTLRNINLEVKPGENVAICGEVGSGKSTLLAAILGEVSNTQGTKYYLSSAKEFMRINGTTQSLVANHLTESMAGSMTIRAFGEEDRFFKKSLELIDTNEWLIQRLEALCAVVLASSALCMVLLPLGTFSSGLVGMALSSRFLSSSVLDDGSNWSILRRSKILVLDEATASIDNATDSILQKTIRTEFADSTVITVAHRIPTVMDCTMVLAISDGRLVEYDEPMNLMKREDSLFGKLVKEYWSHYQSADSH